VRLYIVANIPLLWRGVPKGRGGLAATNQQNHPEITVQTTGAINPANPENLNKIMVQTTPQTITQITLKSQFRQSSI
jgi:hypothetical protein